ncbi:MAG: HprK-related kinase B [Thermodesulfobacteriota bacterium]
MTDASRPLARLAQDLLARDSLDHRLHLVFGDCSIRMDSNSAGLVEQLRRYYAGFVHRREWTDIRITALEAPPLEPELALAPKEPDPGKTKVKEEFVEQGDLRLVRKRLTGMCFIFGADLHLAAGPCVANANQVVNFINSRHIQWLLDRGGLLFHAAGVCGESGGLALAGFSGSGKSTLALHLMSRGVNFVSNDRLVVRRGGAELTMYGVAKLPRINPGTALNNPHLAQVIPQPERRRFASLPADDLWSLEHKYDAHLDQCFGPDRFQLAAPLKGLVVLNWRREPQALHARRVDLRERPDLMAAFMKSPGLFYQPAAGADPDFSPPAYQRLLADCPVYEFGGGVDFAAAAETCLDLVAPLRHAARRA